MAEDDEKQRTLKEIFDANSDESDDDDEGPQVKGFGQVGGADDDDLGLDSSSEDEVESAARRRLQKGKGRKKKAEPKKKKERKKKGTTTSRKKRARAASDGSDSEGANKKAKGAKGSGDEYDSGDEVKRTKDDDDFIDKDDENLKELGLDEEFNKEQVFNDERPDEYSDDEEDAERKGKKGGLDMSNPFDRAVAALKPKRSRGKLTERLSADVQDQIAQRTAQADIEALKQGKAAIHKIKLLDRVKHYLSKKELQQMFLDYDLLGVLKLWIQPMEDGTLPNLSVRTAILESMGKLPIDKEHLKRSGMGKVVMALWKHPQETSENKALCQRLIEKWSRTVFDKSADYSKSGEMNQERLARLRAMQRRPSASPREGAETRSDPLFGRPQDNKKGESSIRARVPQARPLDFISRPENPSLDHLKTKKVDPESKKGKLLKKMQDQRKLSKKKESRSIKMSIEGRGT